MTKTTIQAAAEAYAKMQSQPKQEPEDMSSKLANAAKELDKMLENLTKQTQTIGLSQNIPQKTTTIGEQIFTNMKVLQATIKQERKSQKLTQRQLATMAGMSQGSITRAENNGWISLDCLLRISNALGKALIIT